MAQNEYSLTDDQLNIRELWNILWMYRWLIGGLVSIAVLGSLIVISQSAERYRSSAIIIPLRGDPSTSLLEELDSEAMRYGVVRNLNLAHRYSVSSEVDARNMLKAHSKFGERDGKIQITVSGRDSALVDDIAKSYVQVLQQRLRTKQLADVSQSKAWLTERLVAIEKNLSDIEQVFEELQEKDSVYTIDQKELASIQVIANIRAQLAIQRMYLPELTERRVEMRADGMEDQQVISQAFKEQLKLLGENIIAPLPKELRFSHNMKGYMANSLSATVLSYVQVLSQLKFYKIYLMNKLSYLKFHELSEAPFFDTLEMAKSSSTIIRPRPELPIFVAAVIALGLGVLLALSLHYLHTLRSRSDVEFDRGSHVEVGS